MRFRPFAGVLTLVLFTSACTPIRLLFGREGRKAEHFKTPRQVNAADVAMVPGYRIEAVATGLTYPTSVLFDDENRVYVTESGHSYGSVTEARLLRVEADGSCSEVFKGPPPPWRGGTFAGGSFYLTAGKSLLRRSKDGKTEILAEGLDAPTRPVVGPDAALYFGQRDSSKGAIMRRPSFGGKLEIFARMPENPTGLAFAPDGELFATGADDTASFWRIRRTDQPERVTTLKTASQGFDFSRNPSFGDSGQAFLAQDSWIVRLDPEKGTVEDFAWNQDGKGPASRLGSFGIEHPIDVRFDRSGKHLFMLDYGVTGVERTGVLWKFTEK